MLPSSSKLWEKWNFMSNEEKFGNGEAYLTWCFCTEICGLAASKRRIKTFNPTPNNIPYSSPRKRHDRNVPSHGNTSSSIHKDMKTCNIQHTTEYNTCEKWNILLTFGLPNAYQFFVFKHEDHSTYDHSWQSGLGNVIEILCEDSQGQKHQKTYMNDSSWNSPNRKDYTKQDCTMENIPVTKPPAGVLTPVAALTAVREKDPVTGMEEKKEPTKLHSPRAIISWLASMGFPCAAT